MKNAHLIFNIENFHKFYSGIEGATSEEVALAICEIRKTETGRMRIWQSPSKSEIASILKRAWELADADTDELYWGGAHKRGEWARQKIISKCQTKRLTHTAGSVF